MTIDVKHVMAEVQENLWKVRGCAKHRITEQTPVIGKKVQCGACGGQMSLSAVGDYIRGYEAAGGDANDIWPGYSLPRAPMEGGSA